MLRKSLALGSCLVASLAVVACQEQSTQPVATPDAASAARTSATASPQSYLVTLWANRAALTVPSSVLSVEKVFAESGRQAINQNDYVCSEQNSPVVQYMYDELYATLAKESSLFFSIYNIYGDIIPTYDALSASKTMNGGNFAFFTFNAFAFSTFGGSVPDKIVMGDGILESYAAIG